jgi:protein MpaA
MTSNLFGVTSTDMPILSYNFGSIGKKILILGGVHGDEIEGVWCALHLLNTWSKSFSYKLQMTLVPQFNIDGILLKKRTNFNGVDLNRNLKTKDWSPEVKTERYHPGPFAGSEKENQSLMTWLDLNKPDFIISLHSWKPLINVNGHCEPFASQLSAHTGYIIEETIGYPTPGCLGTYTGLERNIPTVTYEIERGLSQQEVCKTHPHAICEALKTLE